MKLDQIYKISYDYLIKTNSFLISKKEIDRFINEPDIIPSKLNSWEDVFDLLLDILQNYQMYPKVIKYREREKYIKQLIKFPDLTYISKLDPNVLAKNFKDKYESKSNRCWINYSKGIVSSAKFLSSFSSFKHFKETCDSFDKNDTTRLAFALLLSVKINNMGFALACNFLKELGYFQYPKPDIHMKDICKALKIIGEKSSDLECYEALISIARKCDIEPYKLDKVWWLNCSGEFYRYNKKNATPNLKKSFINYLVDLNIQQ